MNQMEIFKSPEFGSIRVVEENGKYLFCGADAARALGYARQSGLKSGCLMRFFLPFASMGPISQKKSYGK